MRLDDYIAELSKLAAANGGDLEVEKWMPAKGRHTAPLPVIAYMRRFTRTRDVISAGPLVAGSFWHPTDSPHQKGPAVIRI